MHLFAAREDDERSPIEKRSQRLPLFHFDLPAPREPGPFARQLRYVILSNCLEQFTSLSGMEDDRMHAMPAQIRDKAIDALYAAVPGIQRDFLMRGPLRTLLPADIRADIVHVFTQVLCRAIKDQDGEELASFIENVVWESRKMGVAPRLFMTWIDHYAVTVRALLDDEGWNVTEPMLALAHRRIQRLQN